MRIQKITVTLILAILLSGCGALGHDPASVKETETQTGDESLLDKGKTELSDILSSIQAEVQSGTAGSTLKAAKQAASLMDWAAETKMTADEIKKEVVTYLQDMGNDAQVEFSEKMQTIDNVVNQLLQEGQEDFLESTGLDKSSYPWKTEVKDTINAIMEAVGLR